MADPRLVAFRVQTQRKLVSSIPLHIDCLPLHDNLASTGHALERPTLQSFVQTVLSEGMDFIHDTVPKFPRSKTVNVSGPAKTEVLISKAVLDVQKRPFPSPAPQAAPQDGEVPDDEEVEMQKIQESWIVRKSIHPNLPLTGTASWDEFCAWAHTQYILNAKLFLNHVCDVALVGHYDCANITVPGFKDISAQVCLMVHRVGPPLLVNRRVFPVVIVSAQRSASLSPGFIQVQLPIHPDALHTGWERYVPAGSVVGQHTSIQFLKLAALGQGRQQHKDFAKATSEIHWTVAFASAAEGRLSGLLRMADSPQLLADEVKWFLNWVKWRRKVPVTCHNLITRAPSKITPHYRHCNHRRRARDAISIPSRFDEAFSSFQHLMEQCDRRIRRIGTRLPAALNRPKADDPRVVKLIKTARLYNVDLSTEAAQEGVVQEDLTRQETRSGVLTWENGSQMPSERAASHTRNAGPSAVPQEEQQEQAGPSQPRNSGRARASFREN